MFGRQRSKFDDIAIAAPCPISWEEMEGDERIKYCSLCHLNVYNLSEMTRKEGEALFARAGEQVCIRLHRRPDGTIITKDCPVGRRLADACARRVRTLVLALLAFFFAGLGKASAADCEPSDGNGSQSTSTTSSVSETPISGVRFGIGVNNFRVEQSALPRASSLQNSRPNAGIGFAPCRWPVPNRWLIPKPSGLRTIDNVIVPALLNRSATLDHYPPNGVEAVAQKADRSALDAFKEAQYAESTGFTSRASTRYQYAIYQFMSYRNQYDPGFVRQVATAYAKFLRKQGQQDLADAILAEFAAPPPKPKSGIKFSSNKKQEPN